jgi:ribonuclease HII
MPLYSFDQQYIIQGFSPIGVDEAGRGPLAGPVVAAAVCLDYDFTIEGLNDSKKLTAAKREKLSAIIMAKARAYKIVEVPVSYIDEHNILQATFRAMREAIQAIQNSNSCFLIDGNQLPDKELANCHAIIRGDGKSAAIAAASILAKVYRDKLMCQLDEIYPQYGFARHKGYGTREHLAALDKYGFCPVHRSSFAPIRHRTIWDLVK